MLKTHMFRRNLLRSLLVVTIFVACRYFGSQLWRQASQPSMFSASLRDYWQVFFTVVCNTIVVVYHDSPCFSLLNLGHATTVFRVLRKIQTITGVSYHGTKVDSMDLPPVNSCWVQAADWSPMRQCLPLTRVQSHIQAIRASNNIYSAPKHKQARKDSVLLSFMVWVFKTKKK